MTTIALAQQNLFAPVDPADAPIEIGHRFNIRGSIYEVTYIKVEMHALRLREINGNRDFVITIARLRQQLRHHKVRVVRSTSLLTHIALREASLSAEDRRRYEWRCAYVKMLLTLMDCTSKADQEKRVAELHAERTAEQIRQGQIPEQLPDYKSYSRWRKMVRDANYIYIVLAVEDHRKNLRKKRVPEEVEAIISEVFENHYCNEAKISFTDAYDLICTKIKWLNSEIGDDEMPLPVPCLETVRNRMVLLDPLGAELARHGKDHVRHTYNYGGKTKIPPFIGSVVFSDSHRLDILVYDHNLNFTYRPWLTALIDGYTGCIIAWDISALAPSAEKLVRTVRRALAESDGHPFRCIPTILHVDNGSEFKNESLANIAATLTISVLDSPTRTPNSKSMIERFFRTMNFLIHRLSGTTRSNPRDRGDYDSEGNAIYTLADIEQKFRDFLNIYHHRPHWKLKISPKSRWEMALNHQRPRTLDLESVETLGAKIVRCRISRGTVQVKGISWKSPSLPELALRLAASKDEALLAYDPSDLTYAWVRHPRDPSFVIRCEPCDPDYQAGLTMSTHFLIREKFAAQEAATGNAEYARILKAAFIAKALVDAANAKSKKSKLKQVVQYDGLAKHAELLGINIESVVKGKSVNAGASPPANIDIYTPRDDGGWDSVPDTYTTT